MRAVAATDVERNVVHVSVTTVSHAKTAEPIEMPFGKDERLSLILLRTHENIEKKQSIKSISTQCYLFSANLLLLL